MKKDKGITLISLVVTIVIIIILATVTISLSIGKNGIFTRAKETKKLQITSEAKEQIGTEILAAQVDAFERNEELEQSQVEDIISKYGELQEDKDTIILKDNGYEISLLEIYNGTTTEAGSYTENKAKIELLENQVATLQKKLDDAEKNKIDENTNIESLAINTYVECEEDVKGNTSQKTYTVEDDCSMVIITSYCLGHIYYGGNLYVGDECVMTNIPGGYENAETYKITNVKKGTKIKMVARAGSGYGDSYKTYGTVYTNITCIYK